MGTLVFGQGKGKSTILLQEAIEDMRENRGLLYVDPSDETEILNHIPKKRTNDVLILDPTDVENPVGWNILANAQNKPLLASLIRDTVKAIWNYEGMSTPVMDRMLYNTVYALLQYPDSTLFSIELMLVSKEYRKRVLEYVSDSVLLWKWAHWNELGIRDWRSLISSTENKAGEFTEDPRIRNIITHSTFDLSEMVRSQKIIVLRLPTRELGEKTKMLGSLFLAHIASLPDTLVPYSIYIDGVDHFDTPVVRKLIARDWVYVSAEYLNQLSQELRHAIIGNCDERYLFRMGLDDSLYIHRTIPENNTVPKLHELTDFQYLYFNPAETFRISKGETVTPNGEWQKRATVENQSRRRYGSRREKVERITTEWVSSY